MVRSRSVSPAQRSRIQEEFTELIEGLNQLYGGHLRAKFIITLGDEFQGLLRDAEIIPDLVWTLERGFTARVLRLGFGYGSIHTSIKEYAINVDGPALHSARSSLEAAKRRSWAGGVFTGFGATLDPALNGIRARACITSGPPGPAPTTEVVLGLHDGRKGTVIAAEAWHHEASGCRATRR